MINVYDILETIRMIQDECLDIRTITMGISLWTVLTAILTRHVKRFITKITSKKQRIL